MTELGLVADKYIKMIRSAQIWTARTLQLRGVWNRL